MTLYAPEYYLDFACIADRCRHSCCIGWEIDVDEQTLAHYDALDGDYAASIRESIDRSDVPHFRLCAGDRCPHLNEQCLCRIILHCGEQSLCDICREHPRFYHVTAHGMEVGLGIACEEACRIVLASDGYDRFVAVCEEAGETDPTDFDATAHRARIYAVLSDRTRPYAERVSCIASAYGVSPTDRSDEQIRATLASLEYLDETHRAHFGCYSSAAEQATAWERELERALAYFVFRHCSDALDAEAFCASLGVALLCERLLASLLRSNNATDVDTAIELARIVSEEIEYSEENTEALKGVFEG